MTQQWQQIHWQDTGNGNTVTITVNNTLLGQYMTLAESDESDSEDDIDAVNDIAPPKDSSSDSDGTSSEDNENEIVMCLEDKDNQEPLIRILSESDDDEGEVDSTNQAKRQRLEWISAPGGLNSLVDDVHWI